MKILSGVHRDPRAYPWRAIVGTLVAYIAGITLAQLFYTSAIATTVARFLGGRVDVELVAGAGMVGLVALAFSIYKIALADAAMGARVVRSAAIQLAIVWGIGQLAIAVYNRATGVPLAVADGWRAPFLSAQQLVFQFFCIALVEEWVFRGWLIPQLYRRLRARHAEWPALVSAVVIASAIFTLCHIPMMLAGSTDGMIGRLLHIELLALAYSLCYLRTGGIAVGIAFHVLGNAAASLFDSPLYAGDIYLALFWLRVALGQRLTA